MVISGIDPRDVSQTGWGVIFPSGPDPQYAAIREALNPLLDLRKQQAGQYYKEYFGRALGVRPNENKNELLTRYGAGPGPVDPDRVPYYLLLVGSPTQIPFRLQRQLSVQYAVGRLDFETPDEYAAYAQSVVRAEQSWQPQRAVFFGTEHPGDVHTHLTSRNFLKPLADKLMTQGRWEVGLLSGEQATKSRLLNLLGEGGHPALMLLAGHGLGYPSGHPLQRAYQGALLCQEWPGPGSAGPIPPEWCLAADDLPPQLDLTGMIWVQFASFSAGTGELDASVKDLYAADGPFAPEPFSSRLAQRLLSLPGGGALALVGMIGQVWGYAYAEETSQSHLTRLALYQECVDRLAHGDPVGLALEPVRERYAELATGLSTELEEITFGKVGNELNLLDLWTARNDASNLTIYGDPAVRLPVASYEAITAQQQSKAGGGIKIADDHVIIGGVRLPRRANAFAGDIGETRAPEGTAAPSLQAELRVRMARLPTLLYGHLSPERYALADVQLSNSNYDQSMQAHVSASLEGYTEAQETQIEVGPLGQAQVNLLPALLPEVRRRLEQPTRANLNVRVHEAGSGRVVLAEARSIWLMEAQSLPIAVRDPSTAEWQDFALYLGLFITPQAPGVQRMVETATRLHPSHKLAGYQGGPDDVEVQVRAIDAALREKAELRRTGLPELKRTGDSISLPMAHLPDHVLETRDANDLEFALLFASLLEAAGLNGAVFISDRLICPAWQPRPPMEEWLYLDFKRVSLPLIGETLNFSANAAATKGVVRVVKERRARPGDYPPFVQVAVADMRRNGIQPLA